MFYPMILYNSWEQFPQKIKYIYNKVKKVLDKYFKLCYNIFTVDGGF